MKMQVDGQIVRELRIKHSYSQERLAEIVGVNLRTIQRIEANGVASLGTRGALAEAFGVMPEDLDLREPQAVSAPVEPVGDWHRWSFLMVSVLAVVLALIVIVYLISNAQTIRLL